MSSESTIITEAPAADPSALGGGTDSGSANTLSNLEGQKVQVVADGSSTANWRDSLSIDHQNNPALADFKDVDALAKSYIHQGKMIGADKITIPGEDASPEEMNDFFTKMGRPTKVEDYDLESVERPEGLPLDAALETDMVSTMHELGLNQNQVVGLLNKYFESTGGQFQQASGDVERNRTEGIKDLRNSWGKSFDGQIDLAARALRAGAGDQFEEIQNMQMADGGKFGDHPAIIRIFAELGGKMNEHGLVGASATRSTMTPGEAGGEMARLKSDPEFLKAFLDETHLEHAQAVKRINDLTIAEVGDE